MQNNTYILKRTESSSSATNPSGEVVQLDPVPANPDVTATQVEIESDFSIDRPTFKIKYHRSNSINSITTDTLSAISEDTSSLPTIKVLGTGGTIASKGLTSHQTAGYEVDLTIEDLISSIPDLSQTCQLEYEQVLNIDSKEFNNESLLLLHHKIVTDLNKYDGIVITHGTDTMEETAFFIQSTINTYKPIVFCGSMRQVQLFHPMDQ